MKVLWILFILIPVISYSQAVSFRKYKPGEVFKYRLTTEVYRNNEFTTRMSAVSEHSVVKDKDSLYEEIRWRQKTTYSLKDTIQLDSIAQSVSPYRISLSRGGKVLLPALNSPEMTGEITDLNTFYVAIMPALNAQRLSSKNVSFTNAELRKGDFGNNKEIIYGIDCLEVTQKLISSNKQFAVVETEFKPPSSLCITPLIDTIAKKTFSQYNNIEFARKGDDNKINLFWGIESFIITSKINNLTGEIMEASMINLLTLKMRYNTSPDYKTWAMEIPTTIKRVLKLELVK